MTDDCGEGILRSASFYVAVGVGTGAVVSLLVGAVFGQPEIDWTTTFIIGLGFLAAYIDKHCYTIE